MIFFLEQHNFRNRRRRRRGRRGRVLSDLSTGSWVISTVGAGGDTILIISRCVLQHGHLKFDCACENHAYKHCI